MTYLTPSKWWLRDEEPAHLTNKLFMICQGLEIKGVSLVLIPIKNDYVQNIQTSKLTPWKERPCTSLLDQSREGPTLRHLLAIAWRYNAYFFC
jgi:hypothetical protein